MGKKEQVVTGFQTLNAMHYPPSDTSEYDWLLENCPCRQCAELRPVVAKLRKLKAELAALTAEYA